MARQKKPKRTDNRKQLGTVKVTPETFKALETEAEQAGGRSIVKHVEWILEMLYSPGFRASNEALSQNVKAVAGAISAQPSPAPQPS